jgi:hypothetical protein
MLQHGSPLVLIIPNTKLLTHLIFKLGQNQALLMTYLGTFQQTYEQSKKSGKISASHNDVYEDDCLLGCCIK